MKLKKMMLLILIISTCLNCSTFANNLSEYPTVDSEYFNAINLYDINDNLTYKEFFNLDDSLTKLKKMNKDLNSNFDFVELSFQSLEKLGYYDGDKKFSRSSSSFDATNQIVQIDGKETYVTPLKTVQLGNYICMPYFDIEEESTDNKYHLFQQRYYFQKNDGFIKIPNQNMAKDTEYILYRNKLNGLAKKNNLLYDLASAKISIELDS